MGIRKGERRWVKMIDNKPVLTLPRVVIAKSGQIVKLGENATCKNIIVLESYRDDSFVERRKVKVTEDMWSINEAYLDKYNKTIRMPLLYDHNIIDTNEIKYTKRNYLIRYEKKVEGEKTMTTTNMTNTISTGYTDTLSTITCTPSNLTIKWDNAKTNTIYLGEKDLFNADEDKPIKITEVKVFPDFDNPRAVQCYINDSKKFYKAVCDKEDVFDLKRGLMICIAKYLDEDKKLTPEGIEHKADELAYEKKYVDAIDKGIKEMNERLKKEHEEKLEAERIERKKQKNIAKKKRRLERKRQEKVQLIADAIVLANKMMGSE